MPTSGVADTVSHDEPKAEQDRLIEQVRAETHDLSARTARIEHEIDLLLEYRASLVADVVTGKLDVREAAQRLPNETLPDTTNNDVDLTDEIEAMDDEPIV